MTSAAAIQRTLNLIIPTASTLPPSLIDLATSLHAQSRAKAPSLKPDEEIARAFACSHIACERLKNRLSLEIGNVGPPCGPRVYKRLYAFLDSALPAAPSTPRTTRVKDVEATPASGRSARQAANVGVSPSKATPNSQGKRNRAAVQNDATTSDLPRFTMALIRHVCTTMETPAMAMHIYAGVESVYRSLQNANDDTSAAATPSKRQKANTSDSEVNTMPVPKARQVPALVAAVYFFATSNKSVGAENPDEERGSQTQAAVESYFSKQKVSPVKISPETLSQDFQAYLKLSGSGWQNMEWYNNMSGGGSLNKAADAAGSNHMNEPATPRRRPAKTPLRRKEKHAPRPLDEDDHGPSGLLPGLGTMFQPAVDWLSEERVSDFEVWKQDLLSSVTAIEQKG
ncbi:hypothetical protein Q7P37_005316 [Cladosporium fusiforme]